MQTGAGIVDVIIIGGGLAGMAVSIHLARAGLAVACIEPHRDNPDPEESAARAASLLPDATMVTLDSGHFIPINQPESVAQRLSSFFAMRSLELRVERESLARA